MGFYRKRKTSTKTNPLIDQQSDPPSTTSFSNNNNNASVNTPSVLLANDTSSNKLRNFSVRFIWTFVMITSFFAVLYLGHIWVIFLVLAVQVQIFKEVISIADVPSKEKKLPLFRALNWYFLLSTDYFLYGESSIHYFKQLILVDAFLMPLATHHRFISFTLYCIGFVLFVINLKKGHYKFQFSQFAWTHMTLLLVVCQSHFIINNIFEGLIWFLLPISLVVVNDISAYVFGFFFGKTPLIQLSPKKTWEGFIGAFASTLLFAFFFSKYLSQYDYLICPMNHASCTPAAVFSPSLLNLYPSITAFIQHLSGRDVRFLEVRPIQYHALIMATFASLIAPFGGFFASGMKRAFKLKDFGDSIPGHGGATDRMDCQLMMGLFSYMYYQSFIASGDVTIGHVLHQAIALLSPTQQVELYHALGEYLNGQHLLDNVTG